MKDVDLIREDSQFLRMLVRNFAPVKFLLVTLLSFYGVILTPATTRKPVSSIELIFSMVIGARIKGMWKLKSFLKVKGVVMRAEGWKDNRQDLEVINLAEERRQRLKRPHNLNEKVNNQPSYYSLSFPLECFPWLTQRCGCCMKAFTS